MRFQNLPKPQGRINSTCRGHRSRAGLAPDNLVLALLWSLQGSCPGPVTPQTQGPHSKAHLSCLPRCRLSGAASRQPRAPPTQTRARDLDCVMIKDFTSFFFFSQLISIARFSFRTSLLDDKTNRTILDPWLSNYFGSS